MFLMHLYNSLPVLLYNDLPVQLYNDLPVLLYNDLPVQLYNDLPVQLYNSLSMELCNFLLYPSKTFSPLLCINFAFSPFLQLYLPSKTTCVQKTKFCNSMQHQRIFPIFCDNTAEYSIIMQIKIENVASLLKIVQCRYTATKSGHLRR